MYQLLSLLKSCTCPAHALRLLQGKKAKAAKPAPAAKAADEEPGFEALDVRVGRIRSVKKHPNAESLYVEEIDLGEAAPRQACPCSCARC